MKNSMNLNILIFDVLLGMIIVLMSKSGGSAAYGKWAGSKIKSKKSAMLATTGLGVLIFVDDYFNCLTVGSVMRPVTDLSLIHICIAQGIGMALFEDVQYTDKGKIRNNSFMQYKIPTRMDIGKIRVDFESSYEESGPFGAKSIGELVIDTPCPALAEAIYNATGVRFRELPITPEKIAMGILKKNGTDENS